MQGHTRALPNSATMKMPHEFSNGARTHEITHESRVMGFLWYFICHEILIFYMNESKQLHDCLLDSFAQTINICI